MKTKINNIHELKAEIARLTLLKDEQEFYLNSQYTLLKNKVDTPARILGSVTSSIPGVGLLKGVFSSKSSSDSNTANADWLNRSVRLVLPILLNTTLLKNSSWLKKALVMLASQTAVKNVTEDNVSNVVSKLAKFIRPKNKAAKHNQTTANIETERISDDLSEDQILGI